MKLAELSVRVQVKFNQFSQRYTAGINRPLQKFIRQMLFGILKGGKVQLNNIARSLQEGKLLKKTPERLGWHLGVEGLWRELSQETIQTQRWYLSNAGI